MSAPVLLSRYPCLHILPLVDPCTQPRRPYTSLLYMDPFPSSPSTEQSCPPSNNASLHDLEPPLPPALTSLTHHAILFPIFPLLFAIYALQRTTTRVFSCDLSSIVVVALFQLHLHFTASQRDTNALQGSSRGSEWERDSMKGREKQTRATGQTCSGQEGGGRDDRICSASNHTQSR